MPYEPKNYDHLLGATGFSDAQLKNHFSLYQGYVKNANEILSSLGRLVKEGKAGTPEFAEMKRRFGWEFDGMRLHEYYFENMSKSGSALDRNSEFSKELAREFGSVEDWEKDFKGVGGMRGIGWAILYFDAQAGRLINCWINEHDTGHLAGAFPLLIMDVFEHAYMTDYGINRSDYIKAFFMAIDWRVVAGRYQEAQRAVREMAY